MPHVHFNSKVTVIAYVSCACASIGIKNLFLSLFGLPRKTAARINHRETIHGHLFFSDKRSVDEFISASAPIKTTKIFSDVANYSA